MDDVLSLIRSLLEDIQDPLEISSPRAVQAEQETAERAQETSPVVDPPQLQEVSTETAVARQPVTEVAETVAGPAVNAVERPTFDLRQTSPDAPSRQSPPLVAASERPVDEAKQVQPVDVDRYQPLEADSTARQNVQPLDTKPTETARTEVPKEVPSRFTFEGVKPPNWVFREKRNSPEPSPVSTSRTESPRVEVADPLRFAAGVVTATEREQLRGKMVSPVTGDQVSTKQVNQNTRIETIIPDTFPLDARSIFAQIDQELNIPVLPGGNPRYADAVQLPPISVGDSTEQAVAKHYAQTQSVLDFDQRNTFE